jgi:hypothetical protein
MSKGLSLSGMPDQANQCGIFDGMGAARKISVEIPADLLAKAQAASGTGIPQTVRAGLQPLAAAHT